MMVVLWMALGLLGCGKNGAVQRYDNSLFELASGFSAKEVCSCVFVGGHDEAFCRQLTRVSPDVAKFSVDREAGSVTARALGMGKTRAVYQGDGLGCTIVED